MIPLRWEGFPTLSGWAQWLSRESSEVEVEEGGKRASHTVREEDMMAKAEDGVKSWMLEVEGARSPEMQAASRN